MVTNPSVQMEKDEIKQDNLNAKDVNESVEDNDVENFNQFDQEEHLASSIERFTNDVHLEKNPVEIMSFENQEDGNVYPNEILIRNLSTVGIQEDELEEVNSIFKANNENEGKTYNEMHLIRNSTENVRPQNVEKVNENPNEIMMKDLSNFFEDNDTTTIVVSGDFYSAKRFNCSAQGLFYILGYIAKKLKEKCPKLGKKSLYLTEDEKNESLCTWLLSISNGKLFHPSDEFVRDGQDMENEFMNFHACPKSEYETKCY